MTTLDAKHVLIKIVKLHSIKLESSIFVPLSIMHNENEGSILLYISQPINACIAKIKTANILDFFSNVMEAWRDARVDFILMRSRTCNMIKLQNQHMHPYILSIA